MGRIVTIKGLLKQLTQSTLAAFLVALLLQAIRVKMQTPNQEPSNNECLRLSEQEAQSDFVTLEAFYRFYLCEHSQPSTKLLHFVATFNATVFVFTLALTPGSNKLKILIFGIIQAYFIAWLSHFFIEHNKPATWKYPAFSFASDWILFKDLIVGKYPMLSS